MKGKRILSLLLSVATAFMVAACADNSSSDKDPETSSGQSTSIEEPESTSEKQSTSVKKPDDTGVKSLAFTESMREDYINWYGRDLYNDIFSSVALNNAAAGFEVTFWGTSLSVNYISETAIKDFMNGDCYVCVQLDGATDYVSSFTHLPKQSSPKDFTLVKDLEEGEHTVSVFKATEDMCVSFEIYSVSTDGFFMTPPEKPKLKIEAYGDSITAGRGNMRENGDKETDASSQENSLLTYAAVMARELNAEYRAFAVSGARVGKYDQSGANVIPQMFTKYSPTANAKKTWDFAKYSPDVVIVDLGTNDIIGYQRNYYDPEYFGGTLTQEIFDNSLKTQYNAFVTRLKTYYPDAAIVICCGTFNYSQMDHARYNSLFASIAEGFAAEDRVFCHAFSPSTKGHPTYTENAAYGAELAEFIRTTVLTEKNKGAA